MSHELADHALDLTISQLKVYHSAPSDSQIEGLQLYLKYLDDMIHQNVQITAELIPFDPGYGKNASHNLHD